MKPVYLVERRPCTLVRWNTDHRVVLTALITASYVTLDGAPVVAFGAHTEALAWLRGRR